MKTIFGITLLLLAILSFIQAWQIALLQHRVSRLEQNTIAAEDYRNQKVDQISRATQALSCLIYDLHREKTLPDQYQREGRY